jgi:hypothetical protein
MAAQNPYESDPDRGGAWEQGYEAGFAEPEVDHSPPVAPELVDVFAEGELAGRDDRRMSPPDPPPADPPETTEPEPEGGSEAEEEAGHLLLEVGVHADAHLIGGAVGGLVGLVLLVLQIPGDVQLRPLEPQWEAPADRDGDVYLAVCPVSHPLVMEQVTPDGYWTGPGRQTFEEAEQDVAGHEHAEAFVALCSTPEGVCGPVQRSGTP